MVNNTANLAISNNIGGFHLYGSDLCIIADILGYSSYVINFHVYHKSGGNADDVFLSTKKSFVAKYQKNSELDFLEQHQHICLYQTQKSKTGFLIKKLG